jgi:hypothetical protein
MIMNCAFCQRIGKFNQNFSRQLTLNTFMRYSLCLAFPHNFHHHHGSQRSFSYFAIFGYSQICLSSSNSKKESPFLTYHNQIVRSGRKKSFGAAANALLTSLSLSHHFN